MTISECKYFSKFRDWDGITRVDDSESSFISDQLESYYYVVDNSYSTTLENMSFIEK